MEMEKQRNENILDTQKTNCKLEDVNLNLSVITLHVNGLTNPIKKQMDRLQKNMIQLYPIYKANILD